LRILIITHSFYPANEPRAFRWSSISKNLELIGHNIDILTISASKSLINSNFNNEKSIIRVTDPINSVAVFNRKNSNYRTSAFKKQFKFLLKKLFEYLKWPDYAFCWIIPAYIAGKNLFKKYNYDAVISVSNPFSSHIVAYLLLKNNKDIKWVCDYGDPFSFEYSYPSNNLKIYKKLNHYIEKKIILRSKKITVTNEAVISLYKRNFNLTNINYKVIPPIINTLKSDPQTTLTNFSFNQNTINLVYSGVLYSSLRNPLFLLKLVHDIQGKLPGKKINLHFFGNLGDCNEIFNKYINYVNDWLFLHGNIQQNILHNYLLKASFLVNIGNKSNHQLPSKIFEYITTCIPIINIVYSEKDLTIDILKKYNASCLLINNFSINESDRNKILNFIVNTPKVNIDFVNSVRNDNSSYFISKMYLDFLNE
jgi:hypothetical protein